MDSNSDDQEIGQARGRNNNPRTPRRSRSPSPYPDHPLNYTQFNFLLRGWRDYFQEDINQIFNVLTARLSYDYFRYIATR